MGQPKERQTELLMGCLMGLWMVGKLVAILTRPPMGLPKEL
jgi:hypothetical protein